jgi:large repetitive protein
MRFNNSIYRQAMRIILFASLLVVLPLNVGKSHAQKRARGIPANIYTPSMNSYGFLTLESPQSIKPATLDFIFGYNYALTPIYLNFSGATSSNSKNALRQMSTFDFGFTMGITERIELSFLIPLHKVGAGDAYDKDLDWSFTANDPLNTVTRNIPSSIPGDTVIGLKYNILKFTNFAIAIRESVILPFGVEEMFGGEQDIAVKSSLLFGFFSKTLNVIANVSHLYRNEHTIQDPVETEQTLLASGQEIHLSMGMKWNFSKKLSLMAGGVKYIPLSDNEATDSPVEIMGGVQWRPSNSISVNVIGGSDAGLADEYGRSTPMRVGAYITWKAADFKKVIKVGDKDKDGVPDDVDACPDTPEDIDKFEDEDGCPDPDNDQDGIPDKLDKCPLEPEDEDGYKDSDGCPDPDNDGDGILDSSDRCPGLDSDIANKFKNTIEDKDQFEDEDGCPDFDNDKDGIPDTLDKCPNKKETVNGIDDNDGCPDTSKGLKIKDGKINLKGKIKFKKAKAIISKVSLPALLGISNLLKSNPSIRLVRIEGHSDSKGREKKNLYLSSARANSVRNYLISKGVSPYRLQAVGYGSRFPLKPNNSNTNRAINRRVEFIIVYQ